MDALERIGLIRLLTQELDQTVDVFIAQKEENGGRMPRQNDGIKCIQDGYGVTHVVQEGLRQSETFAAIDRKIVLLREQLNELRRDLKR